jgi:hypothetical protein
VLDPVVRVLGQGTALGQALGTRPTHRRVAVRHRRHRGRARARRLPEYWAGGAMNRPERTRRWYLDNADMLQQALI